MPPCQAHTAPPACADVSDRRVAVVRAPPSACLPAGAHCPVDRQLRHLRAEVWLRLRIPFRLAAIETRERRADRGKDECPAYPAVFAMPRGIPSQLAEPAGERHNCP